MPYNFGVKKMEYDLLKNSASEFIKRVYPDASENQKEDVKNAFMCGAIALSTYLCNSGDNEEVVTNALMTELDNFKAYIIKRKGE